MSQPDPPAGDRTEEFLRHYGACERQLYVYIVSLLPNATDAQDVLQETSIVLWNRFDQFDIERSFFAWARGIAYRKVLKFREKNARQTLLLREATLELVAHDLEQRTTCASDDRQEALAKCLERLKADDRDLIRQRYAPGVTVQALAGRLSRTPNALSHALMRIRRDLLDCMTRRLAAEGRSPST
ncbi:MAG: sigma-70 family RNA polymerase sigma factor [Planctomycetales bacterium]|nr:sigma-70 family RNA polymerase sigma factor [Planctomycetales bacterium]